MKNKKVVLHQLACYVTTYGPLISFSKVYSTAPGTLAAITRTVGTLGMMVPAPGR